MTTELILPKSYKNEILEKNLNAFFHRYPYERSRLELLLSEPVDNRPVAQIELPACPSKPPLRVIILGGIGSPQFLSDLFNDKTVLTECFQIFVVENNLDFLRFIFQYANLTQAIIAPKFEWLLMHNEESIKPAFFNVLKREAIASLMYSAHLLETSVPQPAGIPEFYQKMHEIYKETCFHIMHNFGRIGDSLDGIRATLMNKDMVLTKPGIDDLKGAYKDVPALIVGAGPSLDSQLETIKKNNDRFVVIAADAALKPLLKAGIRVDYCTSIERLNNYQRPFFEGLPQVTTELVAFPVVLPSQFELYPGPIRIVYRNYSYFAYFEKAWPKGIVKCGGSTSHLALRLADWFGCRKIFLVGLDSAYEKHPTEDLYRSHCSGTGHVEWSSYVPLKEFAENRKHLPPIMGTANDGSEVTTNLTYYQWAKEFTGELSEVGNRIPIVNCSPKGLRIEGIPFTDFMAAIQAYDERFEKIPYKTGSLSRRKFEHKVVVHNFEAWILLSKAMMEECDSLLTVNDQSELEARFDSLLFCYNYKIVMDSLFVSFVIQCCAKEFFELENKWWSLDLRFDVDLKEKTAVMKERLQLFVDVLSQLVSIFKEVGNGQQVYKFSDN